MEEELILAEVICQRACRVGGTWNLLQRYGFGLDLILDPKLRDTKMPHAAESLPHTRGHCSDAVNADDQVHGDCRAPCHVLHDNALANCAN